MPKLDSDSIVTAYDRYSNFYDLLFGRVLQDGREALSQCLHQAVGHNILELGVGSGLMLPLYPARFRVTGVDISPGMLARAKQRVEGNRLNVELYLIDAETTGFQDGAFDHVVLPYVYSVTPQPMKLMHEAFRLCRPGGTIWILNHFSGLGLWDRLARPLKPFARGVGFRPDFSYQTYITDLGLTIAKVTAVNLFGLSRLVQVQRGEDIPDALTFCYEQEVSCTQVVVPTLLQA